MSVGGDPGPDESGLPPFDIEIPDDARELERDIQAYYRELRSLRWRRRTRWAGGPLARDGMVLPFLAGCLVISLLAGTLLTVFTSSLRVPPSASPPPGHLPDAIVLVNGIQTPLRDLRGSVLALVPPGCACAHLRQLTAQADQAGVQVYIVGTGGTRVDVLTRQTGLGAGHAVEDSDNALAESYHPVTLTAVVVDPDGSVAGVIPDQGQGFQLAAVLQSMLAHGSA